MEAGANGAVTLRQLATHTSGLPRLAPNLDLHAIDRANPYAAFAAAQAEEGLRQAALNPDRPHLYSNFGYQLLGLALERASGHSYQELLSERLLGPLGMTCSGTGSSGGGIRLPGHAQGGEVPHWDHLLAGAGASRPRSVTWPRMRGPACTHRGRRWAPRSPRRRHPRSRSGTAGTRPWAGRYATTAPASTAAGPAGSPPPSSSTPAAAGQS